MLLMRKLITSLLFVLLIGTVAMAQKRAISNIQKIHTGSMNPIIKDNQVIGYVLLYQVDQADKKNSNYNLSILNSNLEEIAIKKIIEPRGMRLCEADFDGKAIMLKFLNASTKIIKYYCLDMQANIVFQKEVAANSYNVLYLNTQMGQDGENDVAFMFALPNKGFVDYSMFKEGTIGYKLNYYSSDGKSSWTVGSNPKSKDLHSAMYLEESEDMLFSLITSKPNLFSYDVTFEISGININEGKEVFKVGFDNAQAKHNPLEAYYDAEKKQIRVMGLYFDPKDNVLKGVSQGMFLATLDLNGKILTSSYLSWKEGLSKYFKVKDNGKIADFGYFYFHNIVHLKDGSFYAIAEQYRKKVDGLAVSTGSAGANIVIEDLYIMEFSNDFKLKSVTPFEKKISKVYFGDSYAMMDAQTLALMTKIMGDFDYQYTTVNKEETRFFTTYLDYTRGTKGKFPYTLCFIIKGMDEAYKTDKIILSTDANVVRILPAKTGYTLIYEYRKSTKTLDMRLEKINY